MHSQAQLLAFGDKAATCYICLRNGKGTSFAVGKLLEAMETFLREVGEDSLSADSEDFTGSCRNILLKNDSFTWAAFLCRLDTRAVNSLRPIASSLRELAEVLSTEELGDYKNVGKKTKAAIIQAMAEYGLRPGMFPDEIAQRFYPDH
jgi:hypothetical protein